MNCRPAVECPGHADPQQVPASFDICFISPHGDETMRSSSTVGAHTWATAGVRGEFVGGRRAQWASADRAAVPSGWLRVALVSSSTVSLSNCP